MSRQVALSRWVDFVMDLGRQSGGTFPAEAVMDLLHESFAAIVHWGRVESDGSLKWVLLHSPPGWPSPEFQRYALTHHTDHPLHRWYARARDIRPMTIDRVPASIADPRLVQSVRAHQGTPDLDHQMTIPVEISRYGQAGFVLARGQQDFSVDQLQLAHQLQPLLMLLHRQARLAMQLAEDSTVAGRLTVQERAVFSLLHRGLTSTAIGRRLSCSPRTIEKHLEHIYRKLGVRDRLAAVRLADGLRAGVPLADRGFEHLPGAGLRADLLVIDAELALEAAPHPDLQ